MSWRLGVGLLSVAVLVPPAAPAGPAGTKPAKAIAVPPGHKLLARLEARGVQIYKAVEAKPGKLEWALEAPLADLFYDKGLKAGCHYEGPSWEAADGSKVVRDKTEEVKAAPAPDPKKDVPWLLVKVKPEAGKAGAFSPVVFVQRLQTAGGTPPPGAPKRAGTKVGVAYTAVYALYAKAE
jgi:hypothetical protein